MSVASYTRYASKVRFDFGVFTLEDSRSSDGILPLISGCEYVCIPVVLVVTWVYVPQRGYMIGNGYMTNSTFVEGYGKSPVPYSTVSYISTA
jgi:hypothetical protein